MLVLVLLWSILHSDGSKGGSRGLNPPAFIFCCLSVFKMLEMCLFQDRPPPFRKSWTRPCYNNTILTIEATLCSIRHWSERVNLISTPKTHHYTGESKRSHRACHEWYLTVGKFFTQTLIFSIRPPKVPGPPSSPHPSQLSEWCFLITLRYLLKWYIGWIRCFPKSVALCVTPCVTGIEW